MNQDSRKSRRTMKEINSKNTKPTLLSPLPPITRCKTPPTPCLDYRFENTHPSPTTSRFLHKISITMPPLPLDKCALRDQHPFELDIIVSIRHHKRTFQAPLGSRSCIFCWRVIVFVFVAWRDEGDLTMETVGRR